MPYMPVNEAMFLIAETREQPMHVGGLQLFEPREGQTASDLAEEVYEKFHDVGDLHSLFRKRPASPVTILGNVAWTYDEELDFDYHVRRIVLPRPGRIRELLRYISLHHGALLDRNRPMWEVHVIEGLTDGQLAIYSKLHHSLVDGVTALRLLERTLTTDPESRDCGAPWEYRPSQPKTPTSVESSESGGGSVISGLMGAAGQVAGIAGAAAGVAGQIVGVAPAAARIAWNAVTNDDFTPPFKPAPKTILDVAIGSARRFAAQQWEIERLRSVAAGLDMTLNDVVVAMCSGALRSYLIDRDELPDSPLIALMPVSLHSGDEDDGNAVTAILCNLATDQPDPERRVHTVIASTREAKRVVRQLSPLQQLALGAINTAPLALATVPGFVQYTPPQFNLIISNVPGPTEEMYWNGARLTGVYPVSIPMEGSALNITVTSTADHVNFGLIGARKELPSLQRLLTHLDTALEELEKVARVTPIGT